MTLRFGKTPAQPNNFRQRAAALLIGALALTGLFASGITTAPASGKDIVNRQLYRGQPVPYDWVHAGTPRNEKRVQPPALNQFRVPASI